MSDNMSIHKYYNKIIEIMQSTKTQAKQNEKYWKKWDAINDCIEEYGLAAFLVGLKQPYFGYEQAATPKDLEVEFEKNISIESF